MFQEILCEQDTHHFIPILSDDGETGMARIDDGVQQLRPRVIELQHDHVRARNHDVADLSLGNLEDTLEHGVLLGGQQVSAPTLAEECHDIGSRGSLFATSMEQARPPTGSSGFVATGR